jgi:hypothetical protein
MGSAGFWGQQGLGDSIPNYQFPPPSAVSVPAWPASHLLLDPLGGGEWPTGAQKGLDHVRHSLTLGVHIALA